MQEALEKYTKAFDAVENHKKANAPVFAEHQKLFFALIDAEEQLKDKVAETKESVSNSRFTAGYTPRTTTVYNLAVIFGALSEKERQAALDAITIDTEQFERLVASKLIQDHVRVQAAREQERPARIRITIRPKSTA